MAGRLSTLLCLLLTATAVADTPAGVGLETAWKARAELAGRRLASGGLDACDKAVERAFQTARANDGEGGRMYPLDVEVEGKKLLVSYTYQGGQLDSFAVLALPARWVMYQKAGSKTVRFVIGEAKCAFDLCSTGPTPGGPCAETPSRH